MIHAGVHRKRQRCPIKGTFDIAEIAEDIAVLVAQKQAQIFGCHIDSAGGVTLAFGRDIRAGNSSGWIGPEKGQEQPAFHSSKSCFTWLSAKRARVASI